MYLEEIKKNEFMFIYECFPLDFFYGCGLPIEKWLAQETEDDNWGYLEISKNDQYKKAKDSFLQHYSMEELRHEPYVVYDIGNDTHCFIFKLENNGTTIVVSEYSMDYLDTIDGY